MKKAGCSYINSSKSENKIAELNSENINCKKIFTATHPIYSFGLEEEAITEMKSLIFTFLKMLTSGENSNFILSKCIDSMLIPSFYMKSSLYPYKEYCDVIYKVRNFKVLLNFYSVQWKQLWKTQTFMKIK